MKIKAGIVGYGNLGKAVERELIKNKKFKLVAIFSRRTVTSKYGTNIENYSDILKYKGKIDIIFMCGGSAEDIEVQLPEIASKFSTINCFDTHSKLKKLTSETDKICKCSGTVSLMACGWDPGIFSMVRTLMYSLSEEIPVTFWGRGISMGHSDAIRKVDGVVDGVQFTVPSKSAILKAKKGQLCDEPLHYRECYVLASKHKEAEIEDKIKSIPNYFLNQPTFVNFVDLKTLSKLKSKQSHKGMILSNIRLAKNKKATLEFKAKMDSNSMFTALVMVRYSLAAMSLANENQFGAYLPIDIPISKLLTPKELGFAIKNLC